MNIITQQLVHRYIQNISQMNDGGQAQLGIAGLDITNMRRGQTG